MEENKKKTNNSTYLISAIKRTLGFGHLDEPLEGLHGRLEDEDAGVEAVGPTNVRRGGELFSLKQLVDVTHHQGVRVHEHAFGKLCGMWGKVQVRRKVGGRE